MYLENVLKCYVSESGQQVKALNLVTYKFEVGKFYAIMGESGSGKSTLINILGLMDKATKGSVFLDGVDTRKCSDDELCKLRNEKIGFVFQNFYLNNKLTALENVLLPMYINGNVDLNKAKDLLKTFNVLDRESHYPYELSGGEQQRVSLARALVNNPKYILADEPTGNLDSKNEDEVFNYLKDISKDKCVIVVSHNEKIKNYADKVVYLEKGVLKDEN
ncbi:aBC transporter ATP-binding protein [Clostridium sp. CAG:609]|nr:aBC transporter ATP-binding protein [Clostridium sp. CAG:609]